MLTRFSGKTRTFKPRKDVPEGTKQYQLRKYAEATLVPDDNPTIWRCNLTKCFQGSGNLRLAVQLPEGEDESEWLAVHSAPRLPRLAIQANSSRAHAAVDFFNHLNMLYGTVTEFCTKEEVRCMAWPPLKQRSQSYSVQLWQLDRGEYLRLRFAVDSGCCSSTMLLRFEYLWEDGVKYRRPTKLPAPDYVDTLMNWVQAQLDDESIFPNKIGASCPLVSNTALTRSAN